MSLVTIEDDGYMEIEVVGAGESRPITIDVIGFINEWGLFLKQHEGNPELSKLIRAWLIEKHGFPDHMSGRAARRILDAIVDQYEHLKKKDIPESKSLPESQDSTAESTPSS